MMLMVTSPIASFFILCLTQCVPCAQIPAEPETCVRVARPAQKLLKGPERGKGAPARALNSPLSVHTYPLRNWRAQSGSRRSARLDVVGSVRDARARRAHAP